MCSRAVSPAIPPRTVTKSWFVAVSTVVAFAETPMLLPVAWRSPDTLLLADSERKAGLAAAPTATSRVCWMEGGMVLKVMKASPLTWVEPTPANPEPGTSRTSLVCTN